jgi:hypothetical protein
MDTKVLYFADDKRGNRNYNEILVPQLIFLVYNKRKKAADLLGSQPLNYSPHGRKKCFIWYGAIQTSKPQRLHLWTSFLKDLRLENSAVHIPLHGGGPLSGKGISAKLEETFKTHPLYNEIHDYPLRKGVIQPDDIEGELVQYKYGFLARCWSFFDSLNYKPTLFVICNVLPFIDEAYDPGYVYIPKEIQDRLIVRNSKDIEDKVKYFDEHDDERLELISSLRKLFRVDEDPQSLINETVNKYFI